MARVSQCTLNVHRPHAAPHAIRPAQPTWHKALDNCIDFLFISDIVLNFRTAYYNDDFEMILDKKLIRERYLKSWFPLDLFASFPFEIIMQIAGADSGGSASALGVLKLPRLARLSRILKKLDKLKGANYVRVVHTLTSFLLLAHWIACIWYLAGVSAYNNKWDYNETHRWPRTDNPSVGESWLQRIPGTPLTPQSKLRQLYLSSFYWALTMMMKSPFVGPDAIEEKIIGIFIIFFASLCFAFLLTTVSTLYAQLTTAGAVKRDQIGNLIRFTSFMGVPKNSELKLLHYFDALHNLTDGQDDVAVLLQLPYQLRLDVVSHIYRDTLLKAPMFNKCSTECASQLCIQMKPAVALENDNVVSFISHEMPPRGCMLVPTARVACPVRLDPLPPFHILRPECRLKPPVPVDSSSIRLHFPSLHLGTARSLCGQYHSPFRTAGGAGAGLRRSPLPDARFAPRLWGPVDGSQPQHGYLRGL